MTSDRPSVLVYEAAPADLELVVRSCERLGLEALPAATLEEARRLLEVRRPKMAVVDCGLPLLEVPMETKVVVVGEVTTTSDVRALRYHCLLFMPKPLLASSLMYALVAMAGIRDSSGTAAARFVALQALVEEMQGRLASLAAADEHDLSLEDSVKRYCIEMCPEGRKAGDDRYAGLSTHEILFVLARRGSTFCPEGKVCPLMQFLEDVPAPLRTLRPADLMRLGEPRAGETLADALARHSLAIRERIVELYRLRHNYCVGRCPKAKEGVPSPAEGRLLTDYDALMRGEKAVYCPDPACPLDRFLMTVGDDPPPAP